MVDSGAAENVLQPGDCSHVKLSATRRSETGIGFRGEGGERIRNLGQRKFNVRMEETVHVSGQDGRRREPCASRQQGSQNSQTERRRLCGKLETCSSLISGSGKMQPAGGQVFTGKPSPEVCVSDEG